MILGVREFYWMSGLACEMHQEKKVTDIIRDNTKSILRTYFGGLSLAGIFATLWLAVLPSDTKGVFFIGYSPLRILLMAGQLAIAAFFFVMVYINPSRSLIKRKLSDYFDGRKSPNLIPVISLLFFLLSITFFLFFPLFQNGRFLPYFQRLSPIFAWFLFFSISTPLCLFFCRKNKTSSTDVNNRNLLKIALMAMFVLLAICAFIFITKIGITPDSSYWDDHKPVPVMAGQLFLIFTASAGFLLFSLIFEKSLQKRIKQQKNIQKWLEVGLFLIIWFSAILTWIQLPVPNSYFTPPVKPPNNEVYPYSDARIHDSDALGILLGEVNASQRIIRRPLYAVFLAGLHTIGGNQYSFLVLLQTIVLGLVPALIYLIVNKLGNRLGGVIAAVLAIQIEWNTLQVASLATTSNTKLLMTEWPAMLLLVILAFTLVAWSKMVKDRDKLAITVGGSLGALIMLRSQSLILIPFILVIFFAFQKGKWKKFLVSSTLFFLTIAMMIVPLLIRNWQIIGKITFEDPRYTQAVIQRFENQENIGGIAQQEALDETNTDLFGSAIQFLLKNPTQYIGFVANNFFHNEILDIFIFPIRSLTVNGLTDLFNPKSLFWINADNILQFPQYLLLSIYLIVICIGIAYAFMHWKLTGLIPLIIHLAYNFSNAVSRISGWRFILPVQWIILLYFALGIIQLLEWVFLIFHIKIPLMLSITESEQEQKDYPLKQPLAKILSKSLTFFIPFLILGLLIPLSMTLLPKRYANQNRDVLIQQLFADKNWAGEPDTKKNFMALLDEGNISILKGKAFYPRFYRAEDGEPGLHPGIYRPEPYPRLLFLLINDQRLDVLLPIQASPEYFPNGSEVIVMGRESSTGFETILVNVLGEKSALYFANMQNQFTND